ncbi:MAG: PEP-CTERM sorting domain-containing protein [Verrucomicrobiales bacterium]
MSALTSGVWILISADVRDGKLILNPGIPEPSSAMLAGLAGMLLVFRRRR